MANFIVSKATKVDGKAQAWICMIQRPFVSAIAWEDSGLGEHKSAMLMRAAARGRYGVENFKREAGRGSAVYRGSNTGDALPVMFRVDNEGEVTALFPSVAGTRNAWDMTCYAHVGQHGTASDAWARHDTKNATKAERNALYHELRSIYEGGPDPVNLYIVKEFKPWHVEARRFEINQR